MSYRTVLNFPIFCLLAGACAMSSKAFSPEPWQGYITPMEDGHHEFVFIGERGLSPYLVTGLYRRGTPEVPVWTTDSRYELLVGIYPKAFSAEGRFMAVAVTTGGMDHSALFLFDRGRLHKRFPLSLFIKNHLRLIADKPGPSGDDVFNWQQSMSFSDNSTELHIISIENQAVTLDITTGTVLCEGTSCSSGTH